jgi:hypothetical protein
VDIGLRAYWSPPTIPAANLNMSYSEFIEATHEGLRRKFPEYINRIVVGTDSSGTYPIYRYIYSPKTFTRTVSLTAGVHGDEPESYWGLYHVLKSICVSYDDHPALKEIRDTVRIIVIPVVSPWSYENFCRENVNGININRNYDVNWMKTESGSQGMPFSEAESRAVRDVISEYSDDIDFHLDLHTVPLKYDEAGTYGAYSYVKTYSKLWSPMHEVQEYIVNLWNKKYNKSLLSLYQQSTSSNTTNYIQDYLGVPAATLEFASGNFGVLADSSEMTRAVEWYGNVLLSLIYNSDRIKDK